jgi:hypothetical protein
VFSARGTPSDVSPVSVIRTNELTRRGGLRWWQAGLGAIALGLAGAAYMTFGPPRSLLDAGKASTTGAPGPATGGSIGIEDPAPAAPPPAVVKRAPVPVEPPATEAEPGAPAERPRATPPPRDNLDLPSASKRPTSGRPFGARENRATRGAPAATGPIIRVRPRPAVRRSEPPATPREPPARKPREEDTLPVPGPVNGPGVAPILDSCLTAEPRTRLGRRSGAPAALLLA